ncbi:MAG: flagellar basal body-associated FliL family protein [Pseudomonadota bacterium]|nr:flagellar basal body-associated protein FliL [Pseudomonadales bacterium]MDY6919458.1 flagellar basal body-associated FliL family protein [Pseudomonadota bacterium]
MADEENNTEEQAKPKSKLMLIIIIVLVVLLIGGGVAAFLMMSGGDDSAEEVAAEPTQQPAIYFDFKPPFVVNYQWKGRQRYVQISLSLMTRNPAAIETINTHMPLVRNNLVMILGSQDFEMLRTPEGKEALRQSILEELQKILTEEMGEPAVEQVLFTNFVMQ